MAKQDDSRYKTPTFGKKPSIGKGLEQYDAVSREPAAPEQTNAITLKTASLRKEEAKKPVEERDPDKKTSYSLYITNRWMQRVREELIKQNTVPGQEPDAALLKQIEKLKSQYVDEVLKRHFEALDKERHN